MGVVTRAELRKRVFQVWKEPRGVANIFFCLLYRSMRSGLASLR